MLISTPRSLDECYYFMVARNLAEGRGFTTDIEWNFLAGPGGIPPGPSNRFWMPLSSMILAPFFHLLGPGYRVAQIPMVFIGALVPMAGYLLGCMAFRDRPRRLAAWALTLFSPWFFLYWGSVDNFGLYSLVASGALMAFRQAAVGGAAWAVPAGLLSGLSHLSRADGALVAIAGGLWFLAEARGRKPSGRFAVMFLAGLCYLLVMGPWFARNMSVFGSPMAPESRKTILMTSYNQLFHYQDLPTAEKFFSRGPGTILVEKASVTRDSALFLMAGPLSFVLVPLFMAGLLAVRRRHPEVPHLVYGILMFSVLALVFTYPSLKGTQWHSSAALVPLLSVVSVRGASVFILMVGRIGRRKWRHPGRTEAGTHSCGADGSGSALAGGCAADKGPAVLGFSGRVRKVLVGTVVATTAVCVVYTAAFTGLWREDFDRYRPAFAWVSGKTGIVMTPLPGFANYCEGLRAVVMPMDGRSAVLDACRSRAIDFIVAPGKKLLPLSLGEPVRKFGDIWVVRLGGAPGDTPGGAEGSAAVPTRPAGPGGAKEPGGTE